MSDCGERRGVNGSRWRRRPGNALAILTISAILALPAAAHGAPDPRDGVLVDPPWQGGDAGPRAAAGSQEPAGDHDRPRLLSVPYLPQEELLCGSAAAAMVLRYWGARHDARHFARLVDPERHGIPTRELVAALRDEGWRALPFGASGDDVRDHIEAGRPVIALLEDTPDRYHYVVVVAWIDGKVVFHDPAAGPFQVEPEAGFRRRWVAADGWSLLILPVETPSSGPSSAVPMSSSTGDRAASKDPGDREREPGDREEEPADACTALVRKGVTSARSGGPDAGERQLRAAATACPDRAEPLRELAGLRFRQERWAEAARLARLALALSPDDPYTWRLLATARFLDGDREGALDAWNRREEPRVEAVEIRGVRRTRHPVIADALEVRAEDLLTRDRLERGRRRLAALPTMALTRLRYEAPEDGRSTVVAAVVERPLLPGSPLEVGAAITRSLARREISLELAGPTGGGLVWEPWWRWREGSSGVGLRVALPAPARIGGVWSLRLERTETTVAAPAGTPTRRGTRGDTEASMQPGSQRVAERDPQPHPERHGELREQLGIGVSDWSSGHTRWELRSGWDRWQGRDHHLFLGAGLGRRLRGDRVALKLEGTGWEPLGSRGGPFVQAGGFLAWRSSSAASSPSRWVGDAGLEVIGGDPPRTLWPGAGAGEARRPLLRAHPSLRDGALRADALGRRLLHGTTEYRRRIATFGPVDLIAAGFLDAARVWRPAGFEVDVGTGLRLRLPGQPGSLHVDVARGLRDGATGVSAGWRLAWPGWPR